MADKVKTSVLAKRLDVSTATIKRLSKDKLFPIPTKIGRENYFDSDLMHDWLRGREVDEDNNIIACSDNLKADKKESAVKAGDKIISGVRFLELVGRSKGWLWLNVVKPKTLTRINLSPDPKSNKLINYFIEREVYTKFGDLIEVAGEEA